MKLFFKPHLVVSRHFQICFADVTVQNDVDDKLLLLWTKLHIRGSERSRIFGRQDAYSAVVFKNTLVPDGEGHFTASPEVVVSPPLWGWLFGLGDGVEVLSPDWAVDEFKERLQAVWLVYNQVSDGAQFSETGENTQLGGVQDGGTDETGQGPV